MFFYWYIVGSSDGSTGSFTSGTICRSMLDEVTYEALTAVWCRVIFCCTVSSCVIFHWYIPFFLLHHHSFLLIQSMNVLPLSRPFLPAPSSNFFYFYSTRTLISLDGAADLLRPYLAEIVAEYFRIMEEVENDAVLSALQVRYRTCSWMEMLTGYAVLCCHLLILCV